MNVTRDGGAEPATREMLYDKSRIEFLQKSRIIFGGFFPEHFVEVGEGYGPYGCNDLHFEEIGMVVYEFLAVGFGGILVGEAGEGDDRLFAEEGDAIELHVDGFAGRQQFVVAGYLAGDFFGIGPDVGEEDEYVVFFLACGPELGCALGRAPFGESQKKQEACSKVLHD